ncbi:MAG: hypothetical protein H7836_04840 [Magnetococcus sp. YQC-3]
MDIKDEILNLIGIISEKHQKFPHGNPYSFEINFNSNIHIRIFLTYYPTIYYKNKIAGGEKMI